MACDLCSCEDHPLAPCPTCLNCTQHYQQVSDYDHTHTEYVDGEGVTHAIEYVQDDVVMAPRTKPHYAYCGKTGEIREVSVTVTHDDDDWDMIADAFGL